MSPQTIIAIASDLESFPILEMNSSIQSASTPIPYHHIQYVIPQWLAIGAPFKPSRQRSSKLLYPFEHELICQLPNGSSSPDIIYRFSSPVYGGFLKCGYPLVLHFIRIFHEINNLFFRVPPIYENPHILRTGLHLSISSIWPWVKTYDAIFGCL